MVFSTHKATGQGDSCYSCNIVITQQFSISSSFKPLNKPSSPDVLCSLSTVAAFQYLTTQREIVICQKKNIESRNLSVLNKKVGCHKGKSFILQMASLSSLAAPLACTNSCF